MAERDVYKYFVARDQNADGFISKVEAKEAIEKAGFAWNDLCQEAFDLLDTNKDEKVSVQGKSRIIKFNIVTILPIFFQNFSNKFLIRDVARREKIKSGFQTFRKKKRT